VVGGGARSFFPPPPKWVFYAGGTVGSEAAVLMLRVLNLLRPQN